MEDSNMQVVNIPDDLPISEYDNTELPVYSTNFSLSYSQYLTKNNKENLTNKEALVIANSLAKFYEDEASVGDIRLFFDIPESDNDLLEFKFFNIETKIIRNDADYQMLLVKYTLKFGRRLPVENLDDPRIKNTDDESKD